MKILLFSFLSLLLITTSTDPTPSNVPQNFGTITVTHIRGDSLGYFMTHLNHFATMDCQILAEINIVWNNEQTPQEMGILNNSKTWKRPVYFYQTPNNSMNWRYKIPKQSKVKVYFSVDDDIFATCNELIRGFKTWQQYAIGDLGPIVSYLPRFHKYDLDKQFTYSRNQYSAYFSMGLIGVSFLSRHLMQLYYSDLWQAIQMRKHVTQVNNCDDIGMNWITQYIYPELKVIVIEGNIQYTYPQIGQSNTGNHNPSRDLCMKKFTEIFGMTALRIKPRSDNYFGVGNRSTPLLPFLLTARKVYIEKEYIGATEDAKYRTILRKQMLLYHKDIKANIQQVNIGTLRAKQFKIKHKYSQFYNEWLYYQFALKQINIPKKNQHQKIVQNAIDEQKIKLQRSIFNYHYVQLTLAVISAVLFLYLKKCKQIIVAKQRSQNEQPVYDIEEGQITARSLR